MMDAIAIHATLGTEGWERVLADCGVPEACLRNKHGPCPACGGKDRFRFDNKGRGSHFCSQCGAGDGFKLIMKVSGCSFKDAFKRVLQSAGIEQREEGAKAWTPATPPTPDEPAKPTRRVRILLKESCAIEDCDAAVDYLFSRALWPLPEGHQLRAHPSVEYWHDHQAIGRFPALIAAVRDGDSELVTVHVTYLTSEGAKIADYDARKILSPLTGRFGCSAQLMPAHDVLGIAEGIETALSAMKLTGIPTWAALNSSLLTKFEVGPEVAKLVIFADRDIAGLEAAAKLMEKLQEKVQLDFRLPKIGKDWNDTLRASA